MNLSTNRFSTIAGTFPSFAAIDCGRNLKYMRGQGGVKTGFSQLKPFAALSILKRACACAVALSTGKRNRIYCCVGQKRGRNSQNLTGFSGGLL